MSPNFGLSSLAHPIWKSLKLEGFILQSLYLFQFRIGSICFCTVNDILNNAFSSGMVRMFFHQRDRIDGLNKTEMLIPLEELKVWGEIHLLLAMLLYTFPLPLKRRYPLCHRLCPDLSDSQNPCQIIDLATCHQCRRCHCFYHDIFVASFFLVSVFTFPLVTLATEATFLIIPTIIEI
jgi:hypothetical protein